MISTDMLNDVIKLHLKELYTVKDAGIRSHEGVFDDEDLTEFAEDRISRT